MIGVEGKEWVIAFQGGPSPPTAIASIVYCFRLMLRNLFFWQRRLRKALSFVVPNLIYCISTARA
jgi:hypothetical protein